MTIPPPPDFFQGPYPDTMMGGAPPDAHWDNDSDRRGVDMDDILWFDEKPKKKNNNNNNSSGNNNNKDNNNNNNNNIFKEKPVEVRHAGFMLERLKANDTEVDRRKSRTRQAPETRSWSRVGTQELHYDEQQLIKVANDHLKRSGKSVHEHFRALGSSERAAVNDLVLHQMSNEKNKNAKWVYYDISRDKAWVKGGLWTRTEITRGLQVILKRIDNTPYKGSTMTATMKTTTKNGKDVGRDDKQVLQDLEFMDFSLDHNKKKANTNTNANNNNNNNGTKKPKKQVRNDELPDAIAFAGLGLSDTEPMPQNYQQHNTGHHVQDFGPPLDYFNQQVPPPVPGAIPINRMPPQPIHPPHPISARHQQQEPHPFNPLPGVPGVGFLPAPGDFESPHMHGSEWPHPHQHQHSESMRGHAGGQERRPKSARRASVGADPRRMSQLENKVEELTSIIQDFQVGDSSSDSQRDGDSGFSRGFSPTRSWTPPSSPRSHYSEARQRRSLERGKSVSSRPKYRSQQYREVDIEPGYTHRRRDDRDRRPRRLALTRAVTVDDYPVGHGAEPRLVRAPEPPRMQRRSTEYGDGYDYRERERDYDQRDHEFVPEYSRRQSRFDVEYDPNRRRGSRGAYFEN
ncbi:hypothetical protein LTR09_000601 [Extremus antarcticus]|uniref:Uncharacterized protein n=1 Tax=Extremus antarcticus TaxID=702011 RepID=A0AAJ0GJX7_9PEZI|nr:hypothetical protein LTR09_000601 [Extremus antarcticus]